MCVCVFKQLQKQHPKTKEKYLSEYCFSGTYILTLLTEGYNFTADTYKEISVIGKVSGSHFLLPVPEINSYFLIYGQNTHLTFRLFFTVPMLKELYVTMTPSETKMGYCSRNVHFGEHCLRPPPTAQTGSSRGLPD